MNSLLDPTATNHRHQEPMNVYHLYNRIAHSVRFLNEEEKDDLLERIRRIAQFCGLTLLSWCLMTNHFHILVYLPEPKRLSLEEIKERLKLLRPSERALFHEGFILKRSPEDISRRICNIGMYMKIVKENFTLDYNDRTGHHGTMWEGPYNFKKVPMRELDLATVAAYQNLNPVRACMVADYTSYRWTSFAAAAKGDEVARKGLEFIYGGYKEALKAAKEDSTDVSDTIVEFGEEAVADSTDVSDTIVENEENEEPKDVVERMREKMDRDLEAHKRERAEAVWRKRLAGQIEEKPDPLTSEAMVAQVETQMAKMQTVEFQTELAKILGRKAKEDEVKLVRAMAAAPGAKTAELAKMAGVNENRVKYVSVLLQKLGIISREGTKQRGWWMINLLRRFN